MIKKYNGRPHKVVYLPGKKTDGFAGCVEKNTGNLILACDGQDRDVYLNKQTLLDTYRRVEVEFVEIAAEGEYLNFRFQGTEERMDADFMTMDLYLSYSTVGTVDSVYVPTGSVFPFDVVRREDFEDWIATKEVKDRRARFDNRGVRLVLK